VVDKHKLVRHAQHIAEMHRLVAAKLIKIGPHGPEFPQPDHPSVVAWRSHPVPDDDMRDRAWLLYEAGQMVAEAKAKHQSSRAMEVATEFAYRIPHMPMAEVRQHLSSLMTEPNPTALRH
jgi:hypothetical protein